MLIDIRTSFCRSISRQEHLFYRARTIGWFSVMLHLLLKKLHIEVALKAGNLGQF